MKQLFSGILALTGVLGALGAACGSSGAAVSDPPAPDPTNPDASAPAPTATAGHDASAPPPAPGGHGAPSSKYPAFTPDFPRVVNNGGRVLTSPVVVTVTFGDDPNAGTYETLGDAIGASAYWRAVTQEYGIGPATSGAPNHVRVATMPTIVLTNPNNDPGAQIETWLGKQLKAPQTSGFPAPTTQTIYALYFSGPVAQHFCDTNYDGYHESFTVSGVEVSYAIINLCTATDPSVTPLQDTTSTATHEIAEATLDPLPNDSPDGWQGVDADHLAWELMQQDQDETGDMCEYYDDVDGMYGLPDLPVFVQRQWSNASAAAGHAPCVPRPAAPYFNVVAMGATDTVAADYTSLGNAAPYADPVSKGVRLAVGATRKIPLGFYSDAATAPFTLDVAEVDWTDLTADVMTPTTKPTLTLSLDKTSGVNGEIANLSVTVNKTTPTGTTLVLVNATLGGETHTMPILVGQNATAPMALAGRASPATARASHAHRRGGRRRRHR